MAISNYLFSPTLRLRSGQASENPPTPKRGGTDFQFGVYLQS